MKKTTDQILKEFMEYEQVYFEQEEAKTQAIAMFIQQSEEKFREISFAFSLLLEILERKDICSIEQFNHLRKERMATFDQILEEHLNSEEVKQEREEMLERFKRQFPNLAKTMKEAKANEE